jgi:hypothetical protein
LSRLYFGFHRRSFGLVSAFPAAGCLQPAEEDFTSTAPLCQGLSDILLRFLFLRSLHPGFSPDGCLVSSTADGEYTCSLPPCQGISGILSGAVFWRQSPAVSRRFPSLRLAGCPVWQRTGSIPDAPGPVKRYSRKDSVGERANVVSLSGRWRRNLPDKLTTFSYSIQLNRYVDNKGKSCIIYLSVYKGSTNRRIPCL